MQTLLSLVCLQIITRMHIFIVVLSIRHKTNQGYTTQLGMQTKTSLGRKSNTSGIKLLPQISINYSKIIIYKILFLIRPSVVYFSQSFKDSDHSNQIVSKYVDHKYISVGSSTKHII